MLDRVLTLPGTEKRLIVERLEATMREMGVTFEVDRKRPWGKRAWFCDALPELFGGPEWEQLSAGLRQRLRAFELFLQDIHGPKEILRQHVIPARPVLGSPYFQRPAVGPPLPGGAFLHLAGAAVARLPDGRMAVTHHYFSQASGISYMMQNRRALSRVYPEIFQDHPVRSIADTPAELLETFRALAPEGVDDPAAALLTGGTSTPAYSEHSFLARRTGIPLVQGGDLLVLDDKLYLKTVAGLERIHVLYVRLADAWLDPMVFRRDSLLGVSGLVQCVRRGHVALVNAIGSRLADDRAILPFSARIIRFYLGEEEILPTLRTWWLGDLDQRDHVLDRLDDFDVRPLYGEPIVHHSQSTPAEIKKLRRLLDSEPQNFVAQPRTAGALTVSLDGRGALDERRQDH
ncbi:MAG: circularly permuted type 2 ATP-grasp protein, partial [Chthoniobacterales bacterium]